MNKFLALVFTFVAFTFGSFVFGAVNTAEAGSKCQTSMSRSACDIWKRQQNAPALQGPKRATNEPMRCVAVLQHEPSALALREGKGNRGDVITSYRLASLNWKQTDRGFETTVCFPKRYTQLYVGMTLCGSIGHLSWGPREMAYLKRANVGSSDPACVGGSSWCGQYGL